MNSSDSKPVPEAATYRSFATPDFLKELPTTHRHVDMALDFDRKPSNMYTPLGVRSSVNILPECPLSSCTSSYSLCRDSFTPHYECTSKSMVQNVASPITLDTSDMSNFELSTTYSNLSNINSNFDPLSPSLSQLQFEPEMKESPSVVQETLAWCTLTDTMSRNLREQFKRKSTIHQSHSMSCLTKFSRSRTLPNWSRRVYCVTIMLILLAIFFGYRFTRTLEMQNANSSNIHHNDSNYEHFANQKDHWWTEAILYEIFPASFKDTNGDGFGDLNGIRARLPYLRSLGVTGVRLSPIMAALDYPYQYEHVIDFEAVDPHLGFLDDLRLLVSELHSHGLAAILDINPTVTSDQHPWAASWLTNRSGEYSNFYVTSREMTPLELTSSTAMDRESKELEEIHLSFGGRLLLNWSNPVLVDRMLQVFEFWLDTGIDGFYLRNIDLIQATELEPLDSSMLDAFQILDKVNDVLRFKNSCNLRSTVGSKCSKVRRDGQRILVAGRESLVKLSAKVRRRAANVLNWETRQPKDIFAYFHLIDTFLNINVSSTEDIRDQVNQVFLNEPHSHPWTLWNIGSVTSSRVATRIGSRLVPAAIFLLTMMPGSVSLMYGDELPLHDSISGNSNKEYRGGQLCPMAWTSSFPSGNFSQGNNGTNGPLPWLPSNRDYGKNNVQRQVDNVQRVQRLIAFRKAHFEQFTIGKHGNYLFHYIHNGQIVFERYFTKNWTSGDQPDDHQDSGHSGGEEPTKESYEDKSPFVSTRSRYVLIANLGLEARTKDLKEKFSQGSIKVTSNSKRMREFLYLKSVKLEPGEAIIAQVD
ncbi:Neutral and basic amino acid transport protein rBAT [Halotydeus destructor]|nr:Neutral and basic amino acid transport protein rBAT [Halotydeus destructor]